MLRKRSLRLFFIFLLFFSFDAFSIQNNSKQNNFNENGQCQRVNEAAPRFSFSIVSYRAGDLDNVCKSLVLKSQNFGFSVATLVPAKIFDGLKTFGDGTVTSDEIKRCLDVIWASGLDIVYQPHLESEALINPARPPIWRGEFEVMPDLIYESLLFDPIFDWLAKHADELREKKRRVDIVVSGELDTSIFKFSGEWVTLVSHFRQKIQNLGLGSQVRIGYNPNWRPLSRFSKSPQACENFQKFIASLDFIAPSLYGDWSQMIKMGAAQVEVQKNLMLKRLSYFAENNCSVPQVYGRSFSLGEFAVGGDLKATHLSDENPGMKEQDYILKRRAIYSNLFEWAKAPAQLATKASGPMTINIWAGGLFDPIGIWPAPNTVIDPVIADYFREYRSWRCSVR